LLAFSAYARGDGPLAGISLEAALRSDPEHRMASMLDTALQAWMRPEQIRELAGTGYRLAKRLGVRLPPRRGLRRSPGRSRKSGRMRFGGSSVHGPAGAVTTRGNVASSAFWMPASRASNVKWMNWS